MKRKSFFNISVVTVAREKLSVIVLAFEIVGSHVVEERVYIEETQKRFVLFCFVLFCFVSLSLSLSFKLYFLTDQVFDKMCNGFRLVKCVMVFDW